MLTYALKRIGNGLAMLFTVCFLTFMFLHLRGVDVGRNILGLDAKSSDVAALNEKLGVNRPLLVQFGDWLSHALVGDFGRPWTFPDPVSTTIGQRLAVTLVIVSITMILTVLLSVILGVTAAVYGGWTDRFVQILGLIGFAVPGFLVAFVLASVFAVNLHLFAATGYVAPEVDFRGWIKSVTLPVVALTLGGVASLAQQIRSSVKDGLELDFVRTLRSRGLKPGSVIFKHVLRNAGGPALALIGVHFVGLMSGAVIIEQIFAIQGMGQFAISASSSTDVPSVMGLVVTMAAIVVVVNLAVDLISAALNPKVRIA